MSYLAGPEFCVWGCVPSLEWYYNINFAPHLDNELKPSVSPCGCKPTLLPLGLGVLACCRFFTFQLYMYMWCLNLYLNFVWIFFLLKALPNLCQSLEVMGLECIGSCLQLCQHHNSAMFLNWTGFISECHILSFIREVVLNQLLLY